MRSRGRGLAAIAIVIAFGHLTIIDAHGQAGPNGTFEQAQSSGGIEKPPSDIAKPGEGHTNIEVNSNVTNQPPDFYRRPAETRSQNSSESPHCKQ